MKHNAHLLSAACLLLCAAARGAEGQADPHALVQQLGAKYMYERQAAAAAIARLDPATRQKLLPDLLKLIEEGNWLAQSAAAEALRRMGPAAADSAPRLLKVALAAFEARHQAVVELMLTTMVAVDANAAEGLVGPIAARLDGADAMEAAQLCGLLERIGPGAKAAVPALRKLLASKDPRQASAAARALGVIGPAAESAVGDLAACLASSDTLLAQAALGGLRGIGPAARSAVGDIVGLLGSSDGVLRQAAVDALAGVGAAAVPALNGAVAGGKAGLAAAAADALGKMGPPAKDAVATLLKALKSPDPALVQSSVAALLAIGAGGKAEAISALATPLESGSASLSAAALRTLAKIDLAPLDKVTKTRLVRALTAIVRKEQVDLRRMAAVELGRFGPDAKEAVPALEEAVLGPEIPKEAEEALKKIQPGKPIRKTPKPTVGGVEGLEPL